MDKRIVEFIKEHHLLTLATSENNTPYCCNVFYIYNEENNSLIFSSETSTKHVQDFIENPNVAGTIALETKEVSKIQGLQLLGTISELKGVELDITKKMYVSVFPYAEKIKVHLWKMSLNFIKMTHNKLGFGKKLIWRK